MPPESGRRALRRAVSGLAAVTVALSSCVVLGAAPVAAATGARLEVIDGPDVASYQHPNGAKIHWRMVRASHKEFAIIKATESTSYRNPWFAGDYAGARRAGLVRGSYHFGRPGYPIVRTARAQARYFVARLGASVTTSKTLPPALDLESTGGLGRAALVAWAQAFLLEVRRLTGRTPMIYTYPYFWTSSLGDPVALARYPLWMANYDSAVDPSAMLWQYTSRAKVDGIRGSVDMSRFMAEPDTWAALSDGRVVTAWPAAVPGAPQRVAGHGGDSRATVSWLPGDTGSTPIRSYRVTASPGGASAVVDGAHFQADITGLDNGTAYTFTVAATNARGAGASSEPTPTVIPLVPTKLAVAPGPKTTYGDDVVTRVRLLRPDRGSALPGRAVVVDQRAHATASAPSGDWAPRPTLTTGDRGWVVVRLRQPANSVDLRFTFTGPSGWHRARSVVAVVVHNGVTARLSRTRVRSGHPVTLHGWITPQVAGVRVWRQGFTHHHWQVRASTVTDAAGRYAFRFTPTAKTTVAYRTVVAAFGGRARGASATRLLKVH